MFQYHQADPVYPGVLGSPRIPKVLWDPVVLAYPVNQWTLSVPEVLRLQWIPQIRRHPEDQPDQCRRPYPGLLLDLRARFLPELRFVQVYQGFQTHPRPLTRPETHPDHEVPGFQGSPPRQALLESRWRLPDR